MQSFTANELALHSSPLHQVVRLKFAVNNCHSREIYSRVLGSTYVLTQPIENKRWLCIRLLCTFISFRY